jgi:mRNA interferase RelE/StbE
MRNLPVRFTPEAGDSVKRLHPENKRQIRSAIKELRQNPDAGGDLQEELFGFKSHKSKKYRIIYKLNQEEKIIEIYYVGHRSDVYEQFRSLLNKLK